MSDTLDFTLLDRTNSFSVKFLTKDLLDDFTSMVELFNKNELQLEVKKLADNFFEVIAVEDKRSCWEIVMHKYMAFSKEIRKDKIGGKYHPVIFSLRFAA